jgi:hypothetical protein
METAFNKMKFLLLEKLPIVVIAAGLLFATHAFVTVETETITVNGKTMVVRASSKLAGGRMYALPNMFDNDSMTCWIEGTQDTRAGRWIDITYSEKKRYKGLILGTGCRKDYICLEDFSVPTKVRIKLDEKPAFEYTMDWSVGQGTLAHQDVNMRKTVLWFNSDTAFTTALFQMKFTEVLSGRKYLNLAISDFEPIDAYDTRFDLLSILSARTFNPNDIGVINSPVRFQGDDEPQWIKQVFQNVYQNNASGDPGQDSTQIEKGLNSAAQAITDNAEIIRLVGVLKKLLITDNRMPRFISEGRTMTYILFVGSLGMQDARWDIWRYISTVKTSKGLELTIRYVPLFHPAKR